MPVKLFRIIDKYIIWFFILIFFWLKYIFSHKKNKIINNPRKILIIRLRALWSSLLTFPMIQQLKEHYGNDVQYDLLASSRNIGIFKNQWYFQNQYNLFKMKDILKLIFSFKKYDIVIDVEEYFMISAFMSMRLGKINIWYNNIKIRWLAYNSSIKYNDKQHSIITTLDLMKKIWIDYNIPLNMELLKYTDKDKIKVDDFLKNIKEYKIICMHTWWAETAKERSWPTNKWVNLIKEIFKKYENIKIILSGTDFEKDIVQKIINNLHKTEQEKIFNICWKFNVFEFAYLLQNCDMMISNDTGPMHLAAAMWTNTIGLFGPELPSKFGPWPLDKNIWIYKWRWKAFINVHLAQRKKDKDYSIDNISVEDVMEAMKNL